MLTQFADTALMDLTGLRLLLETGDAAERVWAAWAIGLRLGQSVIPAIEAIARTDIDPGVRRHLVVVLAGANELCSIKTLALNDPDPDVRGTAARYFVRLDPMLDIESRQVVQALLGPNSPTSVVAAVLGEIQDEQHHWVTAAVGRHVLSPDPDVRRMACAWITKYNSMNPGLADDLLSAISTETYSDIRTSLIQLYWRCGEDEKLLRLVCGADALAAEEIIESALLLGKKFTPEVVRSLLDRLSRYRGKIRPLLAIKPTSAVREVALELFLLAPYDLVWSSEVLAPGGSALDVLTYLVDSVEDPLSDREKLLELELVNHLKEYESPAPADYLYDEDLLPDPEVARKLGSLVSRLKVLRAS